MKKLMLLSLVFTLSLVMGSVLAQDDTAPVGIDTICGEAALEVTATETDNAPDDEDTAALDVLLQRVVTMPTDEQPPVVAFASVQKPPAPGAVIFVDAPGQRYFRAVGVADVESCEPLNPAVPFAIGSHTKMFTAVVIYQLHEEGALSTNDLVSDYLPDQIALFDGAETVTIDMLLSHTSGIPDYLDSESPTSIATLDVDLESGELAMGFTPEELIEAGAAIGPMLFEPGAEGQWSYSNTGYIMLGMIIEQVTGQAYNDVIVERVIDPLEMENTYPVDEYVANDTGLPNSYLESPFTYDTSGWNYTQAWSAGNVISTSEDMATFLRALYSGELFQDADTLDAMLTPAAPGARDFSDNFYYMHGGNYKHGFLGHGGQTFGFMSDFAYNPDFDVVIGMWTNSAESYAGQGVYHVGQIVGVTPSFDDVIQEILAPPVVDVITLALADVTGITFDLDGIFRASDSTVLEAENDKTYTINFAEDGTFSLTADCNQVNGSYTTGEENAATIELGPSTLAACPDGEVADTLVELLPDTDSVIISASEGVITMFISTSDGSSVVFVAPAPEA